MAFSRSVMDKYCLPFTQKSSPLCPSYWKAQKEEVTVNEINRINKNN